MAVDPCNPMADPELPAEVVPHHHHAVHHVVGRIRHHIHHHVLQAARPAAPVSDACGKPELVGGPHGGLPALPVGRVPGAAVAPKAALLGGGVAKVAAAALGLASVAGIAGTGAVLLAPPGLTSARPGGTVVLPVTSPQSGSPGQTTTGSSPPSFVAPPAFNAPPGHQDIPKPPSGNTAVPEPSSAALFALAAAAALAARWRFGGLSRRPSSRQPE